MVEFTGEFQPEKNHAAPEDREGITLGIGEREGKDYERRPNTGRGDHAKGKEGGAPVRWLARESGHGGELPVWLCSLETGQVVGGELIQVVVDVARFHEFWILAFCLGAVSGSDQHGVGINGTSGLDVSEGVADEGDTV